jgi:ABC-2 type transport system ATP-binding protein
VERSRTSQVAAAILAGGVVTDVTIEDPPIEDVIERVFADARDERDHAPATATAG